MATTPPESGSILERRKRTLPSIVPKTDELWTPGHEFVPQSARTQAPAHPSAVPSLPSAAPPSRTEQWREKLSRLNFRRSAQETEDGDTGGVEESKEKAEEKESWLDSWRLNMPGRKAVSDVFDRPKPKEVQHGAYILPAHEAKHDPSAQAESADKGVVKAERRPTAQISGRFSPTVRRPLFAYSPNDPVVSPTDRFVPRSVLLSALSGPASAKRASMPPPSSSLQSARSRISMPPPAMTQPQNRVSRSSMPPSSGGGRWIFGPPPGQPLPPSAASGYLPHERREMTQSQQLSDEAPPSAYPGHLPIANTYLRQPEAQQPPDSYQGHGHHPTAIPHLAYDQQAHAYQQTHANQYGPNQCLVPPHHQQQSQPPFDSAYGYVIVPQQGPIAGQGYAVSADMMGPNAMVPLSPYSESGPYLPPMPQMSPMPPGFRQSHQPPSHGIPSSCHTFQRSQQQHCEQQPQQSQQPQQALAHPQQSLLSNPVPLSRQVPPRFRSWAGVFSPHRPGPYAPK